MPKRKFISAFCGCKIPPTKSFASKNKCADCGNLFCDKHLYSYVDEANESITKNAKQYCKNCYYKHHRY